ncbi:TRL-like family protein [Leptospira gomenensis]|uniref:TRL-like family protein n=1 Tax=Leptospira gomenensis TaxID=2484974 RepID=A0A5F1Y8J1_9LEPT|nr:TRL domain-containing protein [Leptospira gomenensis]TGK31510.1 TRL-like family protein [Leptospira gomenensis]TGK44160.1 TRL-like family protein [Leptospira gomenensis]TGK46215.1 TRL-like family protein [Leptospira gomenensis]TGK54740.1 TRL-like family protein [Leptospira gomenensis]
MSKNIILTTILGLCLLFSNCASGPVSGFIFTKTSFAGEFNASNDVDSVKKGEGCVHNVLHLFSWGKASAGRIAMENKIVKIATIDHSSISALGFVYKNYCTIVSGE